MEKKKIIAAGGLVWNEDHELLMIFRRGKWDLPKGKLDEDEKIEECALREVQEETGLRDIRLGRLIGITYHEYFDQWLQEEVIKESHWYEMFAHEHEQLVPQTEEDITEIGWKKKEEIEICLQNSYPSIMEIVHKAG
ncbi:MAG: NUDIX domain-containing protein [Bacteroidota bacterium]|nr:NUDIX domain-containing protein [Bacteroidota bacterium]